MIGVDWVVKLVTLGRCFLASGLLRECIKGVVARKAVAASPETR